MEHNELVQMMVLSCICDDYENLDQTILSDVNQSAIRNGFTIERAEAVSALNHLVARGLAKAYLLGAICVELADMPSLDVVEEYYKTYFYATKRGVALQNADDSWPPSYDHGFGTQGSE